MKNILVFVLSMIFAVSQAQEMKSYIDEISKISIEYPLGWKYQASPVTSFILIRPLEEEDQVFRENINLIINDSQDLKLKEYVGAAKMQLKSQLPNYKVLSTEYIELGGKKYAQIIYQHDAQNLPLQVAYYILLHKGKSYNLTCSTTRDNFETYLPVFKKMVSSFTVE